MGHRGNAEFRRKFNDLPIDLDSLRDDIPAGPAFFAGRKCALVRILDCGPLGAAADLTSEWLEPAPSHDPFAL